MSDELRGGELRVGLLPVHGFVLAGGKSSRMGEDKALIDVGGRPMVEIALEKLRGFCAEVSIAGNRDDLSAFAPVVHEERINAGPAAGVEAGLKACKQAWALFVPVDVPLVPAELLRRWAEETTAEQDVFFGPLYGSFLYTKAGRHPAFCMFRPAVLPILSERLDDGVRKLDSLWGWVESGFGAGTVLSMGAAAFGGGANVEQVERWFLNVNTQEDLLEADHFARGSE